MDIGRKLGLALVAACAALTLAACSGHSAQPATTVTVVAPPAPSATVEAAPSFTMTGVLDVFADAPGLKANQPCQGTGPDSAAIGISTVVYVYDQDGHEIATGGLGQGVVVKALDTTVCKFALTVEDVPDGLPSYGVEVGTYGVQQVSSGQAHSNVFLTEGV